MPEPIRLRAEAADLVLREPQGPDPCTGCDRAAEVVLEVTRDGEAAVDALGLCGTCLATGVAYGLGTAHVREGGAVEDLDPREPFSDARALTCVRCEHGSHTHMLGPCGVEGCGCRAFVARTH